ncbi:metallophosphoesterase [Myxosarcina sp. GI1]|uniref:metallophosphoesterase n=1 Tax=Myxosarcina sp. GI1 TaxID=1541065 RepID=UPI000566F715|nr:metallophosphoesterase [Myxosarcina sp. GI1]
MKRRSFLSLAFLSGLGLALGSHVRLDSSTSASTTPLLRFAAVGDVGTGNKSQYEVAKAMEGYHKLNPLLLFLLTGDNIYEDGDIAKVASAFESPYRVFRQQNIPFYAVLGNHDIRTNNGEDQVRYRGYNMSDRYYTFSEGAVEFFALDTNTNASWTEELAWLEENLARSTAVWKIVFGHHPVYSSGAHGNTARLVEALPPLFDRYNVRLYLNGHDHHYERTKPIGKTTYLTCGAGAKLRPVGKSDWTAYAVSRFSFAVIEAYADQLKIFGVGTDGEIFDRSNIRT